MLIIVPAAQKSARLTATFALVMAKESRGSMKNQSIANALSAVATTPGRVAPKRLATTTAKKKVR
jgi:hypothetical protein